MMPAYETAFERETGVLTGLGAALTKRQCAAHRTGGQVDTDHELPGSAGTIADGVLGMISAPPQPARRSTSGSIGTRRHWTLAHGLPGYNFLSWLLSSYRKRILIGMFGKFLGAGIVLVLVYAVFHLVGALVLGIFYVGAYLFSINRHPRRNCPACKGTGRKWGRFFSYGRRPCRRCAGTSWQYRAGARAGVAGSQPPQPGRGRGGP
jgi:hypothetical protein